MKELQEIQVALVAPKGKRNNFGKYNYRSCEDILLALKPHLKKTECTLKLSDEMVEIGDRIYVKSTAEIKNKEGEIESATAFAKEAVSQKGMSDAQLTGSTSSYSRKYALNGLFAIDDNEDADTQEAPELPALVNDSEDYKNVLKAVKDGVKLDRIKRSFKLTQEQEDNLLDVSK